MNISPTTARYYYRMSLRVPLGLDIFLWKTKVLSSKTLKKKLKYQHITYLSREIYECNPSPYVGTGTNVFLVPRSSGIKILNKSREIAVSKFPRLYQLINRWSL